MQTAGARATEQRCEIYGRFDVSVADAELDIPNALIVATHITATFFAVGAGVAAANNGLPDDCASFSVNAVPLVGSPKLNIKVASESRTLSAVRVW